MQFEQTKEYLLLPKGIALSKTERQEMCRIIESGLKEIYKVGKFSRDIVNISGKQINCEYLFKAVNNRFLLKKIVFDTRNEIKVDINNKEELFDFVKNNINELFHPDGKYFIYVYGLLENTSKKGEINESVAFEYVEKTAKNKGLQIQILKPRKISDDVYGGIDGFFIYNDKEFTIQVKTLSDKFSPNIQEYRKDNNYLIAFCEGFLKEILTDYLVLVTKQKDCSLFKSKGIRSEGSYLLIPKNNLVEF